MKWQVCKKVWIKLGLALTSSFLLEYSSEYLNKYSMNIERSLIQPVNDEEMVLVQGSWGQKGQGLAKLSIPPHADGLIYSEFQIYILGKL